MQNIDSIIKRENEAIRLFFNLETFNVPTLPIWIDNEIINYWDNLHFDIHYLPKISLNKQSNFSLWRDKPSKYFYKKITEGKLTKRSDELPGKWILIDTRDKPPKKIPWINYNDALFFKIFGLDIKKYLKKIRTQSFKDEYLDKILLQKKFCSRFCLSIDEIDELKPHIQNLLKLDENKKIRLPYFIEYNYLGNIFYKQWAKTKTLEWFEDTLDNGSHLAGGSGSVGCLGIDPPEFWSTILTFRPIIEL